MGLTRRRQAFRHYTLSIHRLEFTFIFVPLGKVRDATFPLFVMQCCSSRFSCFNYSYPSSKRPHIQCSLKINFEKTFVNLRRPLTFSNQIPCHSSLFQRHDNLCHFRINCNAVIYQANSCE
jgi:hypothetical protein